MAKTARVKPQSPFIMKSTLSRPPRWFVVTKYVERSGIDVTPNRGDGKQHDYMIAKEKFDVTDQMQAILDRERPKAKTSAEEIARLRAALQRIEDDDTAGCRCEHDDENCCANVPDYCCPFCIAAVALRPVSK